VLQAKKAISSDISKISKRSKHSCAARRMSKVKDIYDGKNLDISNSLERRFVVITDVNLK
jgi:hypothetical protein